MLYPSLYSHPYDIRIWQCTDFACHWHSNTEIYLCLQGQLQILVEGTLHTLRKDDALLVAGNEAHEIFCDTPGTHVILIAFGYALLGQDYSRIEQISLDPPFFDLRGGTDSHGLLQPLLQIKDALFQNQANNIPTDWIFRSSLYAIAASLSEHATTTSVSPQRQLRAKQLERMSGVLQYIEEHFDTALSVEQAAAIAGYDRSYFCKQFRKTMGMTFHRYLNYYRVSIACRLLARSKLSLSTVAERCGFSSQKNLSRLFHEILGMTPSQFRKLTPETKNSLIPL